ncbi:hypothetical protein OAT93_00495 [bacterium]|nr:hypothetical protein [bacterium]
MKQSHILFFPLVTLFIFLLTANPFCLLTEEPDQKDPYVVGLTEGSVYIDTVQAIWYPSGAQAFISKDGGQPQSITRYTRISEIGSFCLTVTNPKNQKQCITNFKIVDNPHDREKVLFVTNVGKEGVPIEIEFVSGMYYDGAKKQAPTMAIWVEDLAGNFLHNLYVSQYPATNVPRGWKREKPRRTCLPYWQNKFGKKFNGGFFAVPADKIPNDIDAVSGASTKSNFQIVTMIDATFGAKTLLPDPPQKVKIFIEILQPYDWGWYFTKAKEKKIFGKDAHVGEPALIYARELDLHQSGKYHLGGTEVNVPPIGYSDFTSSTGALLTDFFVNDGNYSRYIFDWAYRMPRRITVNIGVLEPDPDPKPILDP